MNNDLVRPVGESPVDNLINSSSPPALTTGVSLIGNQGVLERGTVLGIVLDMYPNGQMVPMGGSYEDGLGAIQVYDATASYILADQVDTDAGMGAEVPGIAYRTGHFNRQALIVAEGYALTREDEESLRSGGILLSDALI
ncbi:MAG: head decoration protein [Oscillospiraceae bacterium]|nr:head decoration protein [Oscillospiraceae bacterium]